MDSWACLSLRWLNFIWKVKFHIIDDFNLRDKISSFGWIYHFHRTEQIRSKRKVLMHFHTSKHWFFWSVDFTGKITPQLLIHLFLLVNLFTNVAYCYLVSFSFKFNLNFDWAWPSSACSFFLVEDIVLILRGQIEVFKRWVVAFNGGFVGSSVCPEKFSKHFEREVCESNWYETCYY